MLLHTKKKLYYESAKFSSGDRNLIVSRKTEEVVLFHSMVFVLFSLITEIHLLCGGIWKNRYIFKQLRVWFTSNKLLFLNLWAPNWRMGLQTENAPRRVFFFNYDLTDWWVNRELLHRPMLCFLPVTSHFFSTPKTTVSAQTPHLFYTGLC